MRNFISILTMLALVLTTTMPAHAMPHKAKEAVQTHTAEEALDCHDHGAAKDSSKNDASDKCCDKGVCKCMGGTCHNGLSKIFGNSGDSLTTSSYTAGKIDFADETTDSLLSSRLKRPPRA